MDRVHPFAKVAARKQASIGNMAELTKMPFDELSEKKIIHPATASRAVLKVFSDIRLQLLQRTGGDNFVVAVTSVTEQGGASFVATNLASILAMDKKKTALLIDCNVRCPSLYDLLDVAPDYGITDFLAEDDLEAADIIYATGIPRLRLIPLGRNLNIGLECFSSQRMTDLLDRLKGRYSDRYLVLDIPPVAESIEARILTELCDFVVLVVPYGKATDSQILAAVDTIGEEKIAGLIFNN